MKFLSENYIVIVILLLVIWKGIFEPFYFKNKKLNNKHQKFIICQKPKNIKAYANLMKATRLKEKRFSKQLLKLIKLILL